MAATPETPKFVIIAKAWHKEEARTGMTTDLSFDDVVLHPGHSSISNLDEVDLSTELVDGIPLHIPIVSANMDSVTEAPMAIFMARIGGIGIIHRAMTIEQQVRQIHQVKDVTRYIAEDPPRMQLTDSVEKARDVMHETHRGYVLVVDEGGQLQGLVSTRDVHRKAPSDAPLTEVMTPRDQLIVAPPGLSLDEAQQIMYDHRVEKLPLVTNEGVIAGVITDHDIKQSELFPHSTRDSKGRLRVGVAIGIEEGSIERAKAAIEAGADVLVIDVLHGDSDRVIDTVRRIKNLPHAVPVIAGNVATASAVERLIDAGADAVKVGYGPGAVCTTRVVTGTGMPQFSAIGVSAAAAYDRSSGKKRVPIIGDGSIRSGGDVTKALAIGADTVMVGTALGGTDESPGHILFDETTGEKSKIVTGMAARESQDKLAQARGSTSKRRVAQGTSTRVPYIGSAETVIDGLVGGATSGIGNAGARSIEELQRVVSVGRQSIAGFQEGRPHGRDKRQ